MNTRNRIASRLVIFALMLFTAVSFSMPETADALAKKPAKVKNVRVTQVTYSTVTLRWSKTKRAKKYIVYRADKKNGKYKKVGTVKKTKFKDKRLTTGKVCWYKVRAVNGKRKGSWSKKAYATPKLAKPKFTVKSGGDGPTLTVRKVTGASGYVFYRDGSAVARQQGTVFVDKAIPVKTSHKYKVLAYRNVGGGKVAVSPFSRTMTASRQSYSVRIEGGNTVPTLKFGQSFTLKGIMKANADMRRVEIGVVDASTNTWVYGAKYDNSQVNDDTFDIAVADDRISFGSLWDDVYRYRIYVHFEDGSVVCVLNQTFQVRGSGNGAAAIVATARKCAWPYGTSKSTRAYPDGAPVPEFKIAIARAYPDRSRWGAQPRAGASCDVFVGTVIRASGYDTGFPRGLDGVVKHCKKNAYKWKNMGKISIGAMKPGDIAFCGSHISVYLGDGLVANAHYNGKSYGVIEKAKDQIYGDYDIYRPLR